MSKKDKLKDIEDEFPSIDVSKDIDDVIVERYRSNSNITKAIQALCSPFILINYNNKQLYINKFINSAYGYMLDLHAKLQGVERLGRTDEELRRAIVIQMLINGGSGTPEDIKFAVKNLYSFPKIIYSNDKNEVLKFQLALIGGGSTAGILDLLEAISPVTTKYEVLYIEDEDNLIRFGDRTSELADFYVNDVADGNSPLNVVDGATEYQFQVTADKVDYPENALGFGDYDEETEITTGGGVFAERIDYSTTGVGVAGTYDIDNEPKKQKITFYDKLSVEPKPDEYPDWALEDVLDVESGTYNVGELRAGNITAGFHRNEIADRQTINKLFRLLGQWTRYLDDRKDTPHQVTSAQLGSGDYIASDANNIGRLLYVANQGRLVCSDGTAWKYITFD